MSDQPHEVQIALLQKEIVDLTEKVADLSSAVSGLVDAWKTASGVVAFIKWRFAPDIGLSFAGQKVPVRFNVHRANLAAIIRAQSRLANGSPRSAQSLRQTVSSTGVVLINTQYLLIDLSMFSIVSRIPSRILMSDIGFHRDDPHP